MKYALILLIALTFPLHANASSRFEAEQAVRAYLKDPESAKFGSFTINGNIVCGQVNSKNGYGGYSGFELFISVGTQVYFEKTTPPEEFQNLFLTSCLTPVKAESNVSHSQPWFIIAGVIFMGLLLLIAQGVKQGLSKPPSHLSRLEKDAQNRWAQEDKLQR